MNLKSHPHEWIVVFKIFIAKSSYFLVPLISKRKVFVYRELKYFQYLRLMKELKSSFQGTITNGNNGAVGEDDCEDLK